MNNTLHVTSSGEGADVVRRLSHRGWGLQRHHAN